MWRFIVFGRFRRRWCFFHLLLVFLFELLLLLIMLLFQMLELLLLFGLDLSPLPIVGIFLLQFLLLLNLLLLYPLTLLILFLMEILHLLLVLCVELGTDVARRIGGPRRRRPIAGGFIACGGNVSAGFITLCLLAGIGRG